jgi:hypothetical protein
MGMEEVLAVGDEAQPARRARRKERKRGFMGVGKDER